MLIIANEIINFFCAYGSVTTKGKALKIDIPAGDVSTTVPELRAVSPLDKLDEECRTIIP